MTNERDDGAVLYLRWRNGLIAPALTAAGNRIEVKWSDAARLAAQAPAAQLSPATAEAVPFEAAVSV